VVETGPVPHRSLRAVRGRSRRGARGAAQAPPGSGGLGPPLRPGGALVPPRGEVRAPGALPRGGRLRLCLPSARGRHPAHSARSAQPAGRRPLQPGARPGARLSGARRRTGRPGRADGRGARPRGRHPLAPLRRAPADRRAGSVRLGWLPLQALRPGGRVRGAGVAQPLPPGGHRGAARGGAGAGRVGGRGRDLPQAHPPADEGAGDGLRPPLRSAAGSPRGTAAGAPRALPGGRGVHGTPGRPGGAAGARADGGARVPARGGARLGLRDRGLPLRRAAGLRGRPRHAAPLSARADSRRPGARDGVQSCALGGDVERAPERPGAPQPLPVLAVPVQHRPAGPLLGLSCAARCAAPSPSSTRPGGIPPYAAW
jgi:hypothetical protein